MQEAACTRYEEIVKAGECDEKTRCDSLAYLALIYQENHHDYKKACELYKQSLKITPNHVYSLDHLCALLQSCGISNDAKQLHEYVFELDEEHWCTCDAVGKLEVVSLREQLVQRRHAGQEQDRDHQKPSRRPPSPYHRPGSPSRHAVGFDGGCVQLKDISDSAPKTPTKKSPPPCWPQRRNSLVLEQRTRAVVIDQVVLQHHHCQALATDEEVNESVRGLLTAGWMKKRGWYVTSWRDRFFVIKGRALEYYVTDTNYQNEQPRGTIWLAGCEVEDRGKVDNLYLFAVLDKVAKRTYECACESEDSRQSWMSSIQQVAWGDSVSTAHEHPDAHGGSFALGGIVKKRGWYNTAWQDRYFLLKENVLEYYASIQAFESRSTPRGSINIFDCVVEEKGSNGKVWEFTIRDKVRDAASRAEGEVVRSEVQRVWKRKRQSRWIEGGTERKLLREEV
eukprot:755029-Hanusia_phi.AAC.12